MPLSRGRALAVAALVGVTATLIAAPPVTAATTPAVTVTTVVSGLSHPWDVAFTPGGTLLYTQRGGGLGYRSPGGTVRRLSANFSDLFASGETGLMGLAVDPHYRDNRRIYTCQGYAGTTKDIRVLAWRINTAFTTATRVRTLVSGIPTTSGRHGGCRLRFDRTGALQIGTGDAATGTNPQNLRSLGGKTLRIRPTGAVPTDNPFARDADQNKRLVFTYGHRNVQGMALRPGTDQMWNVEHGPGLDDEVNLLVKGANYGWNPVPGYDESVPMTDLAKFPNALRARWSSGSPTVATSGASFLVGAPWGRWRGALAVATLKGSRVLILTRDGTTITRAETLAATDRTFGRLRAAQTGPDGSLYITTDNGSGDRILRITPRG
ncbi:MAG: aldose sugar dehydrogenase [Actinomycetota bacterium]|jgi:glucose/arabinose dehydrogenase|nr:aldose sugar dehydrogenase [Actinomycetota bacterium]